MSSSREADATGERRSSGLLRVPYVRRCEVDVEGVAFSGFLVNLNVLGAYLAHDTQPRLGQRVGLSFGVPGWERAVQVEGVVAWVNRDQTHPVHSLPPGFGVRFVRLGAEAQARIEGVVRDYVARQAAPRGRRRR